MDIVHDTKQRLLDAAFALFYARSYADVGVQEICEKAGVKKGSFYHFFPSKRDLTLAVLNQSWTDVQDKVLGEAFAHDIPPLARIERLVDMIFHMQQQVKETTGQMMGCQFGNLASELSTQDEAIRLRVERIFQEIEAPIEAALIEAVEQGELPPIDTQATAEAMFAYIEGVVLLAKTRNDPELVKRLGKAVVQIAIPGVTS